jgi:hypothetical protein
MAHENGRSLAALLAELKDELKSFLETRFNMLASELRDKVSAWKLALPTIAAGLVLLGTAWLLLTGALVAAVYVAFLGNAFAVAISLLLVGIAYAILGALAASFAYRGLADTGVLPRRTLRVLREDRLWLEDEVKTRI